MILSLQMSKGGLVLTGIKPTGDLHIGNYLGAIKPSLEVAKDEKGYFFIADLHALNQENDPRKLSHYVQSVAAAWLASGLDPNKHVFYRQSDIQEISELSVILSAVTPKGLMNKAHAYKAFKDRNALTGKYPDAGVNMGLYTYPILMAADILAIQAAIVPVGKDQVQHVEIARDIADNFNRIYKGPYFKLPNYILEAEVSAIPGVDGRKMSKSYNNAIPLFTTPDNWKKIVRKIVTDTQVTHPEDSTVFRIFKSIASHEESAKLLAELRSGQIRWGEAKDKLYEAIQNRFGRMSQDYFKWMDSPRKIKDIFEKGKAEVKPIAQKTLNSVKKATGVTF